MYEAFKRKIQPLINIFHLLKAIVTNIAFGFPSRKIKVIGVTGTDGKTTTTHLIYHILKTAGKKASMISSIYAKVGDQEYDTGLHTTTPDAIEVQRLLKKAVNSKDEYIVLETTSHALDQNRVYGIRYEVSVITNITPEHLDYHRTFDHYLKTKVRLLLNARKSLVNLDDQSADRLIKILSSNDKKIYTYGFREGANYSQDFTKLIPEITDYNNYNYLAAFSAAKLLDINEKMIIKALKSFKLPNGRFEVVYSREFTVVVDFAHTPNAIDNVLSAVKKNLIKNNGRLIHVFGSAGLRDAIKRPSMGEASAKYSDVIIITEEDYRTEDPQKIASQIVEGVKKHRIKFCDQESLNGESKKVFTHILNREEAIRRAIEIAKPGDIVVTSGKSHEKSLCRGKIEYPWDEKEVIINSIRQKNLRG